MPEVQKNQFCIVAAISTSVIQRSLLHQQQKVSVSYEKNAWHCVLIGLRMKTIKILRKIIINIRRIVHTKF